MSMRTAQTGSTASDLLTGLSGEEMLTELIGCMDGNRVGCHDMM